jgi:peroxiredoxin
VLAALALVSTMLAAPAGAAEVAKKLSPAKFSRAPELAVRDAKGDVRRCEPCLAEMPSLEDLERKFSGRPFKVLAVNFAEGEERVKAFLENYDIHLEVLYDKDMGAGRRWNARILPASFVLDAGGTVRYSVIGEADWTAPAIVAAIEQLVP